MRRLVQGAEGRIVARSDVIDPRAQLATIGTRLIDQAHMSWYCAQIECQQALEAWLAAPARLRGTSHLTYRAALDREEAAADDLRQLWAVADVDAGPLAMFDGSPAADGGADL